MKKNAYLLLCLVMALCGCQKVELTDDTTTVNSKTTRSVQFVMKGLSVDYGTRATLASEGMTDLWVYEGTTLLCHQVSTDADFGTPTISLSIGAHDLVFVASKSSGQEFTDHWKCTVMRDTFGCLLTYTVSPSSSSKQVQLNRLNSKVSWTVEDAIPSNVTSMTITLSESCYGLDASLLGTDAEEINTSADVTSKQGVTGLKPTITVLASNGEGTDVTATVTFKDAEERTVCTYTNDITLKANQQCNIHGSFFSQGQEHAVTLSSDWGSTNDYDLQ